MIKSSQIISIIGPTAVGKTGFALDLIDHIQENLPKKYTGFDLISADSRQVYRDLKIISGADIPPDFYPKNNYFERVWQAQRKDTRIYGIGILAYQDEWSVAHFREFAGKIIKKSWEQGRLPLIVGGTGFYHQHLFNPSPTLDIKPNKKLRLELAGLSVAGFQEKLHALSPEKFAKMNQSDKNNKVRLIRALEVISFQQKNRQKTRSKPAKKLNHQFPEPSQLIIGLKDTLDNIRKKIDKRVAERFRGGALQEVEKIKFLVEEFGVKKQIVSATGVKEIGAFLDGQVESRECREKWALREFQYAKRQLTWWKKRPNIKWFGVTAKNWSLKPKKIISDWLNGLPTQ